MNETWQRIRRRLVVDAARRRKQTETRCETFGYGVVVFPLLFGFVIAFSEVALTYPWKKIAEYLGFEPTGLLQMLGTEYKLAISFVILIVVLLVRPTGLFRGKAY